MILNKQKQHQFWLDAIAYRGSITPHVLLHILFFGLLATLMTLVSLYLEQRYEVTLGLPITPYEIVGAILGLLLVLRTNEGIKRWWEGRVLWGGIVNQSRNLAIGALNYGPNEQEWRKRIISFIASFPYSCMHSLRGQREIPVLSELLGEQTAAEILQADHLPAAVSSRIAQLLQEANDRGELSQYAFIQLEQERASLINHIGGCERILKTPLPKAVSIKIRRYILIFLVLLPLGLLNALDNQWEYWLVPLLTMLVTYPMVALDQLGMELQNPFAAENVDHLPLADICQTIRGNLFDLLQQ